MAEPRRSDKYLKKQPSTVRDATEEISEEIRPGGTKPRQEHPNRDRARGDWDRSGHHHDEEPNRPEQ